MAPNKYDFVLYWENIVKKNQQIWRGTFKGKPITRNSVYAHFVIANAYTDNIEDSWIAYPDIFSLLGFMKYVYMPIVYVEWMTREDSEGFINFATTVEWVIDLLGQSEKCKYKEEIPSMEEDLLKINSFFELDQEEAFKQLKIFSKEFSKKWGEKLEIFMYFHVFRTPKELGSFVLKSFEGEDDFFQDQLGLSKEEWAHTIEHIFESEFLKKRFLDLLNNQLPNVML